MRGWSDARIAQHLQLFPEVLWDRYVDAGSQLVVYGWVPHPDGDSKQDFVLLTYFEWADQPGLATSSEAHSAEFSARLYADAQHLPCQRVEEHPVLGQLQNVIRLQADPTDLGPPADEGGAT